MSLAQLWQLQQLELDREKERKQLDRQLIKVLAKEKEALLARKAELQREKAEWQELTKQSKRRGQELAELEAKKQVLEQELYSGRVANPKELGHLEDQLQRVEAKANTLLEDYLKLEEKVTAMENCLQVKQGQLVKDMSDFNQKAKQVRENWQQGQDRLQSLTVCIEELEVLIEPALLLQYRRVQERVGTAALAKVQAGRCGGCGIQLPSIFRQQLKQGNLIKCESCGRLLISC